VTEPVRLAYLSHRLAVGGAELQMLELADHLLAHDFRVDFVSRAGAGPLDERARAMGASVRHIGLPAMPGTPLSVRSARMVRRTSRWIATARRERYDIVDAWLHPDDSFAALMKPLTRTPVVMSARLGRLPRVRVGAMTPMLEATVSRLTDAVVANAEITAAGARDGEGVPARKVHVIRGGVKLPPTYSDLERDAQRSALGAGKDDLVIGCIGNFRPMKRQDLLVDAFGTLAGEFANLRLVLVGDGALRPQLEQQIRVLDLEGRVVLFGEAHDTGPLYDAFDLFVQASNSEGLPNVLLEAASASLPIVATAAGGTGEVIRDGDTGLLVPVDDVESLTRSMRHAIIDAPARRRMGAAARSLVEHEYGMDRFVREYTDLYRGLVERKRRALRDSG
jgi:glycosyltransferase involved in cell wall biosynthesis